MDTIREIERDQRENMFPCKVLGGKKTTKDNCQSICIELLGNQKCRELGCESRWLYCEVCLGQLPRLAIIEMGTEVHIDGKHKLCFRHRDMGIEKQMLEIPSVQNKLREKFPDLVPVKQPETKQKKSFPIEVAVLNELRQAAQVARTRGETKALAELDKPEEVIEKSEPTEDVDLPIAEPIEIPEPAEVLDDQTTLEVSPQVETVSPELVQVETGIFNVKLEELYPSTIGPRREHFHELDIKGIALEMAERGQFYTVLAVKRQDKLEMVKGEELWLAAKQLEWAELKVKLIEFKSVDAERVEYLFSAVENRLLFCSLEMAKILKQLISYYETENIPDGLRMRRQLAESFHVIEPMAWLENHLRILKLHPLLLKIMDSSLRHGQRLELETIVKMKIFNMSKIKQLATAKTLIEVRQIKSEGIMLEKVKRKYTKRQKSSSAKPAKSGVSKVKAPGAGSKVGQISAKIKSGKYGYLVGMSDEALALELVKWETQPTIGRRPKLLTEYLARITATTKGPNKASKAKTTASVSKVPAKTSSGKYGYLVGMSDEGLAQELIKFEAKVKKGRRPKLLSDYLARTQGAKPTSVKSGKECYLDAVAANPIKDPAEALLSKELIEWYDRPPNRGMMPHRLVAHRARQLGLTLPVKVKKTVEQKKPEAEKITEQPVSSAVEAPLVINIEVKLGKELANLSDKEVLRHFIGQLRQGLKFAVTLG